MKQFGALQVAGLLLLASCAEQAAPTAPAQAANPTGAAAPSTDTATTAGPPASPNSGVQGASVASSTSTGLPGNAAASATEMPAAGQSAAAPAGAGAQATAASLLAPGTPAPEVVGYDKQHQEVRLSKALGHPAVVYFYPKDGTPGCTKEACAFRDTWDKYRAAKVTLLGVSADSPESHQHFLDEHKLPFALASDEAGGIAAAYGVGRGKVGFLRVTFLIDDSGKVAKVWENVDPGVHANEVLAAVSSLKSSGQPAAMKK